MLRKSLLIVLIQCSLAGILALAQSNFATLSGSVADLQGRPMREARVEVRAEGTGAVRRVALNNDGLFEVPGLAPGDYTVEVQATSFAPLTRRVRLEIGQQM